MSLLDGFSTISLKDKSEPVSLTITTKNLKFSRSNARALDTPEKIKILLNKDTHQLAIVPARANDEDGVDFTFDDTSRREHAILVKEKAILKAIGEVVTLERDGEHLALKVKGTVYPEEKAVVYDLEKGKETITRFGGPRK